MPSRFQLFWKKRRIRRAVGSCDERGLIKAVERRKYRALRGLLQLGVDPNASDAFGQSVLIKAIRIADHLLVDQLLEAGASPDHADHSGCTPLMHAVQAADKHLIDRLLKASPELNRRNQTGETALMLAVKEGQTTLARQLIAAGAEVDLADQAGLTPLMVAIEASKIGIVVSLLEAGANPEQKDMRGRSALDRPVASLRIRRLLHQAADISPNGQQGADGDSSRLADFLQQILQTASGLVADNPELAEVEQKGRALLRNWQKSLGIPEWEGQEELLAGGVSLFVLLNQEIQRGLSQLQRLPLRNGSEADEASRARWERLESIVAQLAAKSAEPPPEQSNQQEQHFHFHLPPYTKEEEAQVTEAIGEAMELGADRAVEILGKIRSMRLGEFREEQPESPQAEADPDDSSQSA